MIEQLSDSGINGGGAGDGSLIYTEMQLPVIAKKQALRDLPNENNVNITKTIDDSTLQKESLPVKDFSKVSGTKRLSSEVIPPPNQAPSAVNTNGNLVYVRRKTEAEVGKISSSGIAGNNDVHLSVKAPVSTERVQPITTLSMLQTDAANMSHSSGPSPNSPALSINLQNESLHPDPPKSGTIMTSSEDTCLLPHPVGKLSNTNTASSVENKLPLTNPVGTTGNVMPSVEDKSPHLHPVGMSVNSILTTENKNQLHPLGKSDNTVSATENKSLAPHSLGSSDATAAVEIRHPLPRPVGYSGNIMSSAENNHIPPAPLTTKVDVTKEFNSKPLQQLHVQPRVSLRGFDRSAHVEYLQMLRSLSSVELSRLAFELETRSIQLSLEEAREMARVEMLNVMGKSSKPSRSPIALPEK